jgi:aldehyde:ferredoxin oxidoreductase
VAELPQAPQYPTESLQPLHPDIPLIFGSGVLTLRGLEEFANPIGNVTGLQFAEAAVGHNIMGVERLINGRLGVRRQHDTLPDRWFDEPVIVGPFAGERIDRGEFDGMLSRFYGISGLDEQGQPRR